MRLHLAHDYFDLDLDLVFIASRAGSRCRDLLTARLLLRINKASAAFFLQTLSCLTSTRVLTCNPPLGTLYSSQSYDSLSLYFHLLTT